MKETEKAMEAIHSALTAWSAPPHMTLLYQLEALMVLTGPLQPFISTL